MNPENPSRPEIEARITALLLGELPAEEARLLRYTIGQDAGLQKLHDRLQLTIGLVREVSAKPTEAVPLKLSDERRKKLFAHFKTPRQAESIWDQRIRIPRLIEVLVVVALVAMLAAMLLPAFSKAKNKAQKISALSEQRMLALQKQIDREEILGQTAPAATPPPQPGGAAASGGAYSQSVVDHAGVATDSVSEPIVAPAPPPATIVLPRSGSTETSDLAQSSPQITTISGRETQMLADQSVTTISGAISEGNQTALPMPSTSPPASAPAQTENPVDTGSMPTLAYNAPAETQSQISGTGTAVIQLDMENRKTVDISGDQSKKDNGGIGGTFANGTQAPMAEIQHPRTRAPESSVPEATPMAALPPGNSSIVLPQVASDESGSAGAAVNYGLGLQSNGATRSEAVVGAVNTFSGSGGGGAGGGFGGFGGHGFGGGAFRGSSGGGGAAGGIDNFAINNPSPSATRIPSASGSSGTVGNAGEFAMDNRNAEVEPSTGLPIREANVMTKSINPGTSAITFGGDKDVLIDPNTGLPVNAATGQTLSANPLGQFPRQISNSFAFDDTTKTPAGDLSRERFYRVTNGVTTLGDITVAGRLEESSDTTFTKRTDLQPGQNPNSPVSEAELAVNSAQLAVPGAAIYQNKKADLAKLEETHQLLYAKIKAESVDAAIPHTTMAQVVDTAKPATNQSLWQKITGEYASTARIQVQSDGGIIQGMGSPAASTYNYDPYFVQNTFEVIQSQAVLSNAITKLNLNETWGKKFNNGQPLTTPETMEILKGHLSLTPVKNTKLINVTVTEDDPKEAAALANAIALSYADFRVQQSEQIAAASLAALQQSYLEESNRIQVLQAGLDRLNPSAKPQQPDAPLPTPPTDAPIPQPEIQVKANAFSTFSLNVSDVSFQLAAASLEKGRLPAAASIRSEEFINAFDYRDPEPDDSQRIAFKWERAHDPFAHNRDFLRFSLKTAATGRQPGRPLNLVLLLDDSGSMERADRVAIIKEALRILATQLQPQDTLSIVTFARTAHLWADGVPGDQAGAVLDKVSGLTPEGGTNLEEAMRLAYETARRHYFANGMNRVVLITDGAANLGDVDAKDLKAKVETNRKQGIALDCFGIGWEDYNDNLLEQLSSQGDGRYAFLNTPDDAHNNFATKLAGALQIAASGVKVQVEFNPQRTISYRQIGYATHQLTKQQFRDNTIAAGEIAAAEAGNALYTVETDPEGDGPIATVRVRYQIPGTTDYREQSWDVPYTGHAPMLEQASPAMRLAATSASFSEWLSSSPFAAEVTPDQLLNYLNGVPAVYSPDERPKKLEWMIRQAKSLTGK